jgi:predicted RNA binding protein YcfA (HicA-like mRNA interferase family)
MPELPAVTGLEAIWAFARIGFEEVHVKGSHHVLKKANHPYRLSIPVHANKPLKKGTLRSLIRAAGISVEEFVSLLD